MRPHRLPADRRLAGDARSASTLPTRKPSLFIAYLFWLLAGYLGIHRFYLRSAWGLVFIPVFLAIVYCTSQVREVRDDMSRTFAAMEQAQTAVAQAKAEAERGVPERRRTSWRAAKATLKTRTAEYDVAKGVSDGWKSRAQTAGIVLATACCWSMRCCCRAPCGAAGRWRLACNRP